MLVYNLCVKAAASATTTVATLVTDLKDYTNTHTNTNANTYTNTNIYRYTNTNAGLQFMYESSCKCHHCCNAYSNTNANINTNTNIKECKN